MHTIRDLQNYIYEQIALTTEMRDGFLSLPNSQQGTIIENVRLITLNQILRHVNEVISSEAYSD